MSKYSHKNLEIVFGGTVYNCLNAADAAGDVEVVSAQCSAATGNAVTHKAIGASNWTSSATILLEDDAITTENAFALGTSGTFEIRPTGTGVGNKSSAWTNAFVSSTSEPMAIGDFGTLAISFEMDGDVTRSLQTV